MVSIGRMLMSAPRLLLLDEPSFGLAPLAIEGLFGALTELKSQSRSILLVEQRVDLALQLCDRLYVLSGGEHRAGGSGQRHRQRGTGPYRCLPRLGRAARPERRNDVQIKLGQRWRSAGSPVEVIVIRAAAGEVGPDLRWPADGGIWPDVTGTGSGSAGDGGRRAQLGKRYVSAAR